MIASGLRVGAKPAKRGDKKTVKERREVLQQAPIEETFQFFDAVPPAGPREAETSPSPTAIDEQQPATAAPAAAAEQSHAAESPAEEPLDSLAPAIAQTDAADPSPQTVAGPKTSAVDQLGFIRETGNAPAEARRPGSDVKPPLEDDRSDTISEFRKPRPFIQSAEASSTPTPASPSDAPTTTPTPTPTGGMPETTPNGSAPAASPSIAPQGPAPAPAPAPVPLPMRPDDETSTAGSAAEPAVPEGSLGYQVPAALGLSAPRFPPPPATPRDEVDHRLPTEPDRPTPEAAADSNRHEPELAAGRQTPPMPPAPPLAPIRPAAAQPPMPGSDAEYLPDATPPAGESPATAPAPAQPVERRRTRSEVAGAEAPATSPDSQSSRSVRPTPDEVPAALPSRRSRSAASGMGHPPDPVPPGPRPSLDEPTADSPAHPRFDNSPAHPRFDNSPAPLRAPAPVSVGGSPAAGPPADEEAPVATAATVGGADGSSQPVPTERPTDACQPQDHEPQASLRGQAAPQEELLAHDEPIEPPAWTQRRLVKRVEAQA